jgi:hypothetical protein
MVLWASVLFWGSLCGGVASTCYTIAFLLILLFFLYDIAVLLLLFKKIPVRLPRPLVRCARVLL